MIDAERLDIQVDTKPDELTTLPFVYAVAHAVAHEAADQYTMKLYHCPTCPTEELRLTWDGVRRRHAGFCRECKKLWPLPRRSLTPGELRQIAQQRELELQEGGDQ